MMLRLIVMMDNDQAQLQDVQGQLEHVLGQLEVQGLDRHVPQVHVVRNKQQLLTCLYYILHDVKHLTGKLLVLSEHTV